MLLCFLVKRNFHHGLYSTLIWLHTFVRAKYLVEHVQTEIIKYAVCPTYTVSKKISPHMYTLSLYKCIFQINHCHNQFYYHNCCYHCMFHMLICQLNIFLFKINYITISQFITLWISYLISVIHSPAICIPKYRN